MNNPNRHQPTDDWPRTVRVLDYTELAILSKNALEFPNLLLRYGLESDVLAPLVFDVLFANWMEDGSSTKLASLDLTLTVGISFGNFLCEQLSMQWVEVVDNAGTTYAVVHETAEVFCFPIETVKKRAISRELGFFEGVEAVARQQILDSATKHRPPGGVWSYQHNGRDGEPGAR